MGIVSTTDRGEVSQIAAAVAVVLGVLALLFGLLGLGSFWWWPTLSILGGLLAVVTGLLGRRLLTTGVDGDTAPIWGQRLTGLGVALGTAAIVASIVVVVATTG